MKFSVTTLIRTVSPIVFSLALLPSAMAASAPPTTMESVVTSEKVEKAAQMPDEADELITNRQLRASSGSLSQFSVNMTWTHSAGSIEAPFNVVRPNITAAGDTATLQSLAGDVGLRYRVNTKDSVSLSVGLSMVAPFHYSFQTDDPALRSEYDNNAHVLTINDPTVTYRHLDKIWGIQSISQASGSLFTAAYRRNAGFQTGFTASQTFMYELGKSGVSVGTAIQGTVHTFSGNADTSNRPALIMGLYPSVEYVINSVFNLRTVAGVWVNEFRRNGTSFNRIIYQSVGVGISVTRDIFLYPNLQFLPGDLRSDKTNIGLTANVNLF